jgi:hypothetical protein
MDEAAETNMEDVDAEIVWRWLDFIDRSVAGHHRGNRRLVHRRQRSRGVQLARRRQPPVPRREGQHPSTAMTSPFFSGQAYEGSRREFFYFSDIADPMAVPYNVWKLNFKTIVGNLFTGKEDTTNVSVVTNLQQDPWERYQSESILYGRWWGYKLWTMVPAVNIVGEFLATFAAHPPSQASRTLSAEKALTMLQQGTLKN